MSYRGRFAPSPTGPLHSGSLIAALASFLDARANSGVWLVRIEDTDHTRCQNRFAREILQQLEQHALTWDERPISQSERYTLYQERIDQLIQQGRAYACGCSRAALKKRGALHHYDQYCIEHKPAQKGSAIRFLSTNNTTYFTDLIQGELTQSTPGDFILYRRDQVYAYHLAVTIDDQDQQISRVIRGSDLLAETAKHLQLQDALGFEHPEYAHLPLVFAKDGQKLSKQTGAQALKLDTGSINRQLIDALKTLGQNPPAELRDARAEEIVGWGIEHWNLKQVPKHGTRN